MTVLQRLLRVLRANISMPIGWKHGPAAEPPGIEDMPGEGKSDARPHEDKDYEVELAKYYANLEIPYGSTVETAHKAYRRLVKKYHPDLHADDPEKRRIANELTAALTKAFREIEKAHNR